MNNQEFNSTQHLTYEELVAYHKGYLGNTEMHRLETHLIDCPLCNDALEGLEVVEETELEKRLSRIRQTTGTIPKETINKKQWLAIAASVALIATVAVVFFTGSGKEELIADSQPTANEVTIEKLPPTASQPDTTPVIVAETRQTTTIEPDISVASQQQDLPAQTQTTILVDTSEKLTDIDIAAAQLEKETLAGEMAATAAAMPAEDSLLAIAADEPAAEITAPTEDTAALASKAARAGTQDAEATTRSKETAERATVPPKPQRGTRAYNRYLKRNLNYPAAAKENSIAGEVVLQLTIAADGNIANIEVLQSLGYGCDAEAIRLVREGPKWLPGTLDDEPVQATATVTVPFKL